MLQIKGASTWKNTQCTSRKTGFHRYLWMVFLPSGQVIQLRVGQQQASAGAVRPLTTVWCEVEQDEAGPHSREQGPFEEVDPEVLVDSEAPDCFNWLRTTV